MSNYAKASLDNQFRAVRYGHRPTPKELRGSVIPQRQTTIRSSGASRLSSNTPTEIQVRRHPTHQPLTSREYFSNVIENSADRHNKRGRAVSILKSLSRTQKAMTTLAIVLLVLGAYLMIISPNTSSNLNSQAFKLTRLTNKSEAASGSSSSDLSSSKISASMLADYTVAPKLPRYLIIPKLNVDARVLSVGVNSSDAIGAPDNVYDTAWYNQSATPGSTGAMLIDGHVSSWTAHGVFYGIKNLVAGDTIQVKRGDGTMFSYKVVKSVIYPSDKVDMSAALSPVTSGTPGLNLITCTGDVIPGTSEYSERIVVYSEQV